MKCVITQNGIEYKLHPVYDLFGADIDGNIINFMTKRAVDDGPDDVYVRNYKMKKSKKYKRSVFMWETHYGEIPEKMMIAHIDKDETNNRLNNLKLIKITRIRLSPEQKNINDAECRKKWKGKEYICPDCGFETNNNSSWYHRKVCPFSKNQYTDEEKERNKRNKTQWSQMIFNCDKCGKSYKNNYKHQHLKYCK